MTTDRERVPKILGFNDLSDKDRAHVERIMVTDREREDKRRWELLGILRSEPSWKECQEAADEMETLLRENEELRQQLTEWMKGPQA
jgi:hypothetical protein